MPFNPPGGRNEFYASVHVGPDAAFAAELPAFNRYLERVSALLKLGCAESRLAIYLPNEDNRRLDRIPEAERTPAANYRWEMRHVIIPRETEGFAPLWISGQFLRRAEFSGGRLHIGDRAFDALWLDVEWLDGEALSDVVRLAHAGLPVILRRIPRSPGRHARDDYQSLLGALQSSPSVVDRLERAVVRPLVSGNDLPSFWCRRSALALYLFFAHPMTREVRYPLRHGQSRCNERVVRRITIDYEGAAHALDLVFEPYQSLLVRVSQADGARFVDINYRPPEPVCSPPR
jgi:hypothetical protein